MVSPRCRRLLLRLVLRWALAVAVALVCWQLRGLRRPGGDTELMMTKWVGWLHDERWVFHEREPGAFAVHQAVLWAMRAQSPPIEDVYSVSAALAGGLMVSLLFAACRHPLFLLIALANGTVFLFLGHAENYSLAYVTTAAALLLGWRHAHRPEATPLWPVVAAWCVAVALHRVAALMAPAALVVLLRREGWRWRLIPHRRGDVIASLLLVVGLCLFYIIPHVSALMSGGHFYVVEMDNDLRELITPLTQAQADHVAATSQLGAWFLFTLFRPGHWSHMLHFHLTLAPLGLISLVLLRREFHDRPAKFLLAACTLALIWSVFWHPHGSHADWDLFSFMALPLNLTAGLLWARRTSN